MSEQNGKDLVEAGSGQALAAKSEVHPALRGLSELTMPRQIGLMLGLALSVAIAVAVVLWSQEPSYGLLFAEIGDKDAADILEVLDTQGVKYKVDTRSGAIMVPAEEVRELKLKLAAQGLPRSKSLGYDLLDKDQGFGTSKNVEMMRFRRALEGEIAQTIMAIQNVKSARVLLALPQQSVFVRERKKPSASVLVHLYQGRSLDKGQVESIIHLVASSVPQLEAEQVTVVDQRGQLLNSRDSASEVYLTSRQFEYKKNIEEHLMERISNILSPLVGRDGMRTQISADIDFTETDRTQEMFNPDLPALRSEQTSEEQSSLSAVQGIPGALSNQPTPAGIAPETATGQNSAANPAKASGSATKTATRNFELDKTITHTRLATGILRRLSVAVVVDDQHIAQADGTIKTQPYAQEDINRFSDLVRQAVGFDNSRGDQVTVTNVTFRWPEEMEALPEAPVWEQAWFLDLMKQVAAVLALVLLFLGVLRPTFRSLVGREAEEKKADAATEAESGAANYNKDDVPVAVPAEQYAAPQPMEMDDLLLLSAPQSYEKRLEYVQRLVDEDPKLVAQVIKSWVRDG
ncbi:MAG: flagellar M-ring protein FliF [Methylobacter sp.]|uniref:flagellar basal-body MS-ring/collar protein FliF n=1 Tax=Methylobacter sp. TaxID=2051955 RepID=UPI002590D33C|nr:flagellar basal-body MS-ring/collar protein FliF [Methylobacter sp.]MCL7420561.1 flagellar M-ring protein FliF [Methylobacter sp.]